MANKLYEENSIKDIAAAIREKNGTEKTYNVSEMGDAVRAITTGDGGITPTGTISITTNGTHDVAQYANASVNVQAESNGITPSGDITITQNGRFDVTNYAGAVVNVPTGSGGEGISITPWRTGTFSVDETKEGTEVITINHNLGFAPTRMVVWADEYMDKTIYAGMAIVGGHRLGGIQGAIRKTDGSITYNSTCPISNITETTFDFGGMSAAYKIVAGWTYRWFALA